MTIQFRKGESGTVGIIEKVSYKVDGNQVFVTSESGATKGAPLDTIFIPPDLISTEFDRMRRIK